MADARQEIIALAELIRSSVDKLVATYDRSEQPLPSLKDAKNPRAASSLDDDLDVTVLAAACDQLKATFVAPKQELLLLSQSFQIPAALRVVIEAHVAEGLKNAPPEGVDVKELAKPSGVDPEMLTRCLRLLAGNHVFREVSLDKFAHSRLSIPLDTAKSIETLQHEKPTEWYVGTDGVVAGYGRVTDETFRATALLPDWIMHHYGKPKIAASSTGRPIGFDASQDDVADTPFQLAFNTPKPVWEWLPGEPYRQARYQASMAGFAAIAASKKPPVLSDFPWNGLPEGSLVVDVGGGTGSAMLPFAEVYPHLRFVIQDLPEIEKHFREFWNTNHRDLLESGRVSFQAHDFFNKDPAPDAAIYHLRQIIHDWADKEAIEILGRIVDAAGPSSHVMIADFVVPTAPPARASSDASADSSSHIDIPEILPLPPPLVTPTAHCGGIAHRFDLHMLANMAATERTAEQWRRLADAVGLKIVHVVPGDYVQGPTQAMLTCVKKT